MILVLSDIHGNLDALNAILNEAHDLYEIRQYAILGDSYTLGPNPIEVFNTLHNLSNAFFIVGNHEDYLTEKVHEKSAPKIGNFFQGSILYNQLQTSLKRTFLTLGEERVSKIPSFYESEKLLQINGVTHYFCHGRPDSNKIGIGKDEIYAHLDSFLKDCFWAGHIHHQIFYEQKGKKFINPGGSGLPFDGDFRAPYAVIDSDGLPHLHRAEYPYLKVVSKLGQYLDDEFVPILQNHLKHARLVKTAEEKTNVTGRTSIIDL